MQIPTFRTTGKVIYDPPRGTMKRRTSWWAIVRVDREITRYYRYWVDQAFWGRKVLDKPWLHKPAWDAHVSIVRGEQPRGDLKQSWGKYEGEILEIEYEHWPQCTDELSRTFRWSKDGDFWFVTVYCDRIMEIREELGLKTFHRSHLTFGRTYF